MDEHKQTIKVNIQETALFRGMCTIMNEMFNDKRVPEVYKKKISELIQDNIRGIKK